VTDFAYATEVGLAPAEESFYLQPMSISHVSQTGVITTIDSGATRWRVEWVLRPKTVARARALEVLIDRIGADPSHRLVVYPYGYVTQGGALGSWGGAPVVAGGSQSGSTLLCDGASGTSGYGVAGDLFAVNGELKRVVSDVTASAGGFSVSFVPALRASPSDNAPLTTTAPTITCQLVTHDIERVYTPGGVVINSVRLSMIEDIS